MRDSKARVVSTKQLAEEAASLVERVRDTGEEVVVVEGGEPAAILISPAEFDALREHRRFVAAVEEGLADVETGRVLTTDELKQSLDAEFGKITWQ